MEHNIEDKLTIKPIINLIGLLPALTWFKNRKVTICLPCFIKILAREKVIKMLVKKLRGVMGIKRWQNVEVLNTHLLNKEKYVLIINKCAYRNNSNIYPLEGYLNL